MEYKKELLRDVYWSFALEQHSKQAAFEAALLAYHDEISGKKLPFKMNEIVLPFPEVVIQYLVWEEQEDDDDDDFSEPQIKLIADDKKGFTFGEILYKIHSSIGEILAEGESYFFEGLTFAIDDDPDFPGIPVYFLEQGS